MIKLEDLKLEDIYEYKKNYFHAFDSFLDKLKKSPEIKQSIIDGEIAAYLIKAYIEGKISIDDSNLNIPAIILDCINTKAYLSDSEKRFSITDIDEKMRLSILVAADNDVKFILKLWDELDFESQAKNFHEGQEEEDKCYNCGFSYYDKLNHDCESSISGNSEIEENIKVIPTLDWLVSEIIKDIKVLKNKVSVTTEK